MKIQLVEDLYAARILKLYDTEKLQQTALPHYEEAACSDALGKLLQTHFEETKIQMHRLEEIIAGFHNETPRSESKVMRAIIAEATDLLDAKLDGDLLDAALVASLMAAEAHEVSAYSSALTLAKLLGRKDDAGLLTRSLREEKAMDDRLYALAELLGRETAESEEVLKPD